MSNVGEYIGWLGAISLAICSVPQVIQCVKTKTAVGVSWGFLLLWLFGEVFTLIYLFTNDLATYQLIFNYGLNLIGICSILYYKIMDLKNGRKVKSEFVC